MADELFPDAQRILDLYHLKENVYTLSLIHICGACNTPDGLQFWFELPAVTDL